jgi:hypothetical protein
MKGDVHRWLACWQNEHALWRLVGILVPGFNLESLVIMIATFVLVTFICPVL